MRGRGPTFAPPAPADVVGSPAKPSPTKIAKPKKKPAAPAKDEFDSPAEDKMEMRPSF
jgi:hypothetical protein